MIVKSPGKSGKRTICICKNCGKEFSELDTRIRKGSGKFCSNNCYQEYRRKNKKDPKYLNRLYQKKNKYNLLREEYNRLFIIQSNKCAICGESFDKVKACVDHDHITGKVRGLLCHRCNLMLGLARDNVELLQNAVNYLKPQVQVPAPLL